MTSGFLVVVFLHTTSHVLTFLEKTCTPAHFLLNLCKEEPPLASFPKWVQRDSLKENISWSGTHPAECPWQLQQGQEGLCLFSEQKSKPDVGNLLK